jgi:hypothetical protein
MKDFSIYTGIVIQNNDPLKAGRVKVFVPGITNTIYDNWNDTVENKEFSFIDGDLLPIMNQLKEDLPWSECAQGIMGGDTSQLNDKETPVELPRPSDAMVQSPPTDAFEKSVYTPGDYSETAGGSYSIPNVGAHVFVFFKRGNPCFPVYFASAHSSEEWQEIFKDHYPTDYENSNSASEPYQNKHVLNSSKHTLELIDTAELEEVKLSHFSGSNVQMTNEHNSEYAVQDKLTLVDKDKYETVKENTHTNVGKTVNLEVGETINVVVGEGTTIVVNGDGTITVDATTSLNITTPETTIDGNLTVTGNITGQAEVSDSTRTMSADRAIYNSHGHPTAPSGPVSTPTAPQ